MTNHRNSKRGTVQSVFVLPILKGVAGLCRLSIWDGCVLRTRVADPDPHQRVGSAFYLNEEPSTHLTFHFNADPDLYPAPHQSDPPDPPGLHFEPPRDHASIVSIHGPSQLELEHLKLLNFDSNADPNSDQDFHPNAVADPVSLNNADPDPQP